MVLSGLADNSEVNEVLDGKRPAFSALLSFQGPVAWSVRLRHLIDQPNVLYFVCICIIECVLFCSLLGQSR